MIPGRYANALTTPEERDALLEIDAARRALRAEQAEAALRCLEILEAELRYSWAHSDQLATRGGTVLKITRSIDVCASFFKVNKSEGKTLLDLLKQVCTAMACDQAARKAAMSAREETRELMKRELGT